MYFLSSKLNNRKQEKSNLSSSHRSNRKQNTLSKKKHKNQINKISHLFYKQSQSKSKHKSKKKHLKQHKKQKHEQPRNHQNQYYMEAKKCRKQKNNEHYDQANPLYYHNISGHQHKKCPNQKLKDQKKKDNELTFKNKNIVELLRKKKILCQNDGIPDSNTNRTTSKNIKNRSVYSNSKKIANCKSLTSFNFSTTIYENAIEKADKNNHNHTQIEGKARQKNKIYKSKSKNQHLKHISPNKQHKSAYTERHPIKELSKTNKSDQNQLNKTIQENQCEQMSLEKIQQNNELNSINFKKQSIAKLSKSLQKQIKAEEDQQKIIYPKTLLTNQFLIIRAQSISLMSKICERMSLNIETQSLAINYIDFYLSKQLDYQTNISVKVIAITSLLIAVKIDNTQMVKNICGQLMDHPQILLMEQFKMQTPSTMRSFACSQKKNKKKSIVKQNPQQQITQIMEMEMELIMKLNFKLNIKTHIYWVNVLSQTWDKFIKENQYQSSVITNQDLVLFYVCNDKHKKLILLLQIAELSMCDPKVYQFNKSYLILSVIYLLIRIQVQVYQFGGDFQNLTFQFKNSLQKSTNIVFYDKVGINQIFGKYMNSFNVNLSSLISSIQFVSQFLLYNVVRNFINSKQQKQKGKKRYQNQSGNSEKQYKKSGLKTKQQAFNQAQKCGSKSSLLKYSNIKQGNTKQSNLKQADKIDKFSSLGQSQMTQTLYEYNGKIYEQYIRSLQGQLK